MVVLQEDIGIQVNTGGGTSSSASSNEFNDLNLPSVDSTSIVAPHHSVPENFFEKIASLARQAGYKNSAELLNARFNIEEISNEFGRYERFHRISEVLENLMPSLVDFVHILNKLQNEDPNNKNNIEPNPSKDMLPASSSIVARLFEKYFPNLYSATTKDEADFKAPSSIFESPRGFFYDEGIIVKLKLKSLEHQILQDIFPEGHSNHFDNESIEFLCILTEQMYFSNYGRLISLKYDGENIITNFSLSEEKKALLLFIKEVLGEEIKVDLYNIRDK